MWSGIQKAHSAVTFFEKKMTEICQKKSHSTLLTFSMMALTTKGFFKIC